MKTNIKTITVKITNNDLLISKLRTPAIKDLIGRFTKDGVYNVNHNHYGRLKMSNTWYNDFMNITL